VTPPRIGAVIVLECDQEKEECRWPEEVTRQREYGEEGD